MVHVPRILVGRVAHVAARSLQLQPFKKHVYTAKESTMRPTLPGPKLLAKQFCIAEVPPRLAIEPGACTQVGSHRANNEDGHYVDSEGHAFLVADGIGGALAGERASQMAVDLLPR